ncbi:MAG: MOSC domain-containing protein [Polyangiales bacterium]
MPTTESLSARIDGLFFGKVTTPWEGRAPSAIAKTALPGKHEINELGFVADEQADLRHHGGIEKAIHHYPADHYKDWMNEGAMPAGTRPAAFGENIATFGITEELVCIGDTLRLGSALVQISQGRQPCWKVNAHTANRTMAALFQKTGRTGWYYRVLEPGVVAVGDVIALLERPQPEWSVKRVTAARLSRRVSQEDAATLSVMPELAEGWRAAFLKMAGGDRDEDTSARLNGVMD